MDQNHNGQNAVKDMHNTMHRQECAYGERYGCLVKPRTMEEIVDMANEFCDKIWFVRHLTMRYKVEHGLEAVKPEIWARALEAAEKMIRQYGEENLVPSDDFDWGMLNGKLSALRWVMGCEWDMLDT